MVKMTNRSPLLIVSAAALATLTLSQIGLTTAKAQPKLLPDYRVRLEGMQTRRTAGGLEITGRIVNTGRQTLTYTSVIPILLDAQNKEVGRGSGYLTAGPLGPGQAAEFRASEPLPVVFTHAQMTLREHGIPITIEDT